VIDRFYALATCGSEFAGAKVQAIIGRDENGNPTSYAGGDILVRYNHGPERIQGDGTFISSDLSANAFVDLDPKQRGGDYGGAVVRIKIPKTKLFGDNAYITLTGAYLPSLPEVQKSFNKNFMEQYQRLADRMESQIQGQDFAKLSEEQQKAVTEQFANDVMALLSQSGMFGSISFMQDVRTEFSVAIEAPEKNFNFKIGLSQFGDDKSKFLVSMVDVNRNLSFTAGINAPLPLFQ